MTTLDELRRANLQEQRRKAEATAQEKDTTKVDIAPVDAKTAPVVEKAAVKPESASPVKSSTPEPVAVVEASKPVEAATVKAVEIAADQQVGQTLNGNGHVAPAVDAGAAKPAVVETVNPEVDDVDRKARAIMDRFYRGLAHKVIHPTGVKTTVDMPPDLFWRVKRYCHDHNNVTVRQLFLDLVIAVLEEEGY